jgi:hypothetical protein
VIILDPGPLSLLDVKDLDWEHPGKFNW